LLLLLLLFLLNFFNILGILSSEDFLDLLDRSLLFGFVEQVVVNPFDSGLGWQSLKESYLEESVTV
jgi:hypothetical protein